MPKNIQCLKQDPRGEAFHGLKISGIIGLFLFNPPPNSISVSITISLSSFSHCVCGCRGQSTTSALSPPYVVRHAFSLNLVCTGQARLTVQKTLLFLSSQDWVHQNLLTQTPTFPWQDLALILHYVWRESGESL